MTIYERYADHNVLASHNFNALKGYAPGWCHPVFVNQTPHIYDLCVGNPTPDDKWRWLEILQVTVKDSVAVVTCRLGGKPLQMRLTGVNNS